MKRFKANRKRFMSEFHRASPKKWLIYDYAELQMNRKFLFKFKQGVALTVELSIVQLGLTGVCISFCYCAENIDCGHWLEPPQSLFRAEKENTMFYFSCENGHIHCR